MRFFYDIIDLTVKMLVAKQQIENIPLLVASMS